MFLIEIDIPRVASVGTIVFEQRGKRLVVGNVIDRDHFEFISSRHQVTKSESSNASKTINRNTN